ncbi:hypothetical protein D6792_00530, partial [Candidatus Parcubacteria bacterium]
PLEGSNPSPSAVQGAQRGALRDYAMRERGGIRTEARAGPQTEGLGLRRSWGREFLASETP